ncbi:MAG: thioredoxin domain-containing protein [Alphaproteobacteria bacterium]|nr:thioredoxin domain-containing protein [Alphaproteobacteria bacterium]
MAYRIFIALIVLACAYFAFESIRFTLLERSLDNVDIQYTLGNPEGDVTLVAFFDYSCDLCRDLSSVAQRAVEEDGNVKYLLRPVALLETQGFNSAIPTYAAQKQGAFRAMHEEMIENYRVIDDQVLQDLALKVGIDPIQFKEDFYSEEALEHVQDNVDLYDKYRFKYVPTYALNGDIIFTPRGKLSVNDFLNLFNEAREQ